MSNAAVVSASLKTDMFSTPNNYGVTHIAIDKLPDNVAWSRALVVRKYAGFPQNINDGDQIYAIDNKNLIVKVDSVFNSSGYVVDQIGSVTPLLDFGKPQTLTAALSDVAGVAIGASIGKDPSFNFLSTALSSIAPLNKQETGGGFAVNDLVTVKIDGLTESFQPNEYGLPGYYHLYDIVGSTQAVTINPATTAAAADAQSIMPAKVYYSLFIEYVNDYAGTLSNTGVKWKKVSETSAVLVKDTGTVDVLSKHLPRFYIRESQVGPNNDLVDFLRVFAFQLDVYKALSSNVFYNTDVTTSDSRLLELFLKELGVSSNYIPDVAQARTLAANIVKIYKESGSVNGISTLVEAYTGYGANILAGRNYIQDYNTSTFEENTGFWQPVNANSGTITRVGPIDNSTVAFNNSSVEYGGLTTSTNPQFVVASATTSTLVATGTLDPRIKQGQAVSVISTTGGTLSSGTFITQIDKTTNTVKLNKPPATALSNATLRVSSNLISGMGKIVAGTTVATTSSFRIGPKRATLTATATATTVVSVTPPVASTGEYVIATTIPFGTTVVSSTTTAGVQQVTLSTSVSATSGSEIGFSRSNGDRISDLSKYISVEASKPYAFSAYVNSDGAVTGATIGNAVSYIDWYDRTGNLLSTSNGSDVIISTAAATTNKWVPAVVQATAPTNAVYASPRVAVNPTTSTTAWYIDAVQFDYPNKITTKQVVSSTVAQITTETEHSYSVTRYGIGSTNYVTVSGVGAPFDGTFQILNIPSPTTFTYTISSTATTPATNVTNGWVASNSVFEDARKIKIDVLPNRINLITNPSFELSTDFWGSTSVASTGVGINCTIVSTTAVGGAVAGDRALRMSATATGNMAIRGYSGEVYNKTIFSYTTPFKIASSVPNQEDVYYTLSLFTKAATTARDVYVEIYWFDDYAGTVPNTIYAKSVGSTVQNSTADWTRYSITAQAPFGALSSVVEVHVVGAAAGEAHYVDCVLFERSYTLDTYFDGSYDGQSYEENRDSTWELNGIPNSSKSYLYQNRVLNSGRVAELTTDGVYYA